MKRGVQRWYERGDLASYRWIVDGHNVIFARADWEPLQTGGRGAEARFRLEREMTRFGRAIGSRIWIVYDGNRVEGHPETTEAPFLRTTFTAGLQEADERIREITRDCLAVGERPVVISSDRRTLLETLGPGVRSLPVPRFFREVVSRLFVTPEKWLPGGLDDIEAHFLRNSPFDEDRPDRPAEPDRPDGHRSGREGSERE